MNMLALTIILPLIGFVLLAFSRGRWSENLSATIGVGSVGLAALVTAFVGMDFFANGKQAFSQPLWTGRRLPDPHVRVLVHAWRRGLLPLLRLYQPVYRQHGGSGAVR